MAMAKNLVLVLFAIATLLHGSVAQTRHVVGDATGWTIPSGGASTYTNWAANNTFVVGDTLVFNFATGQHDVVKVSKSGYDACNGANGLLTLTTGPATVTLNETGEQYYICSFGTHCSSGGQKLAINVTRGSSATPSPAPQPSRNGFPPKTSPVPSPTQAPAPAPTATGTATPSPSPSPSSSSSPSPAATSPSGATPPSPSSTTTNPSSPSPASGLTPPPQNSAATSTSLGVFGLSATLLSLAAAFFY